MNLRTLFIVLGACAALLGSLPLSAQQSSSSSSSAAGEAEVIITASGAEEEELESSAFTTVITAEEIAEMGRTDLTEVLSELGGLRFTSYAGPHSAKATARGFGENGFGRMKVLVDGNSLGYPDMQARNWFTVPLKSIERIEVARGGHGVLHGGGAVAGVINIITKDPKEALELYSSAEVSSTLSGTYDSAVNYGEQARLSFAAEPFDIAFDLQHRAGGGYRDRTENQQLNALISGGWDVSALFRTELDISYTHNTYQLPGGLTESEYEGDPSQAVNQNDEDRMNELQTRMGIELLPSDMVTLSADGAYRYQWRETDMPSFSTPTFTDKAYHIGEGGMKAVLADPYAGVPWRIIAGMEGEGMRLKSSVYNDEERSLFSHRFTVHKLSGGTYLRTKVEATEMLLLDAGARYDAALIDGQSSTGVDDSKVHQALVYDCGLTFNPVENGKVALRGGTLFRYPFTDEQVSVYGFGSDTFYTELDAETGWNVELNTAYSLENLIEVKAGAYLTEMDNEIAYNPATFKNENLKATRHIGGDAELTVRAAEWMTLSGGYSYVYATFIEGPNEGSEIPLVPQHRGQVSADVSLPADITVSPSVEAAGSAWQGGDKDNTEKRIAPYMVVDLRAAWPLTFDQGELELILEAKNLLDAVYAPLVYYSTVSGNSAYYPAPGRSLSLSAGYSY
jgi:iron complex outermembrane receptor protein